MGGLAVGLTADQKRLRMTGITASEAPIIAGTSPYKSPFSVWLEKMGRAPEVEETPNMTQGTYLEGAMCNWYSDQFNAHLVHVDTMVHPEYPQCIASLDRLRIDLNPHINIECKAVGPYRDDEWEFGVPASVQDQCQWQMFVSGTALTHVVSWIWGKPIQVYEVHRDDARIEFLFQTCMRFWQDYVESGLQPPVDHMESTREAISHLYPSDENPLRPATQEELQLIIERQQVLAELEPLEQLKKRLDNEIRNCIGISEGIQADGVRVTWKSDKNKQRSLRFKFKGI